MMLVKALLTSTSFATGFEGGPIFQLIFMGGILGLALSEILTFIPQGGGRGDCRNARHNMRCISTSINYSSLVRTYTIQ
jgi:H+/Cl- antiporter ClcA